jgi:type IV pilus assembly protein PilA
MDEHVKRRKCSATTAARSRGFTMIELMVVLAVIALLALLAAPNLTQSLVRNQIAQSLPLASIAEGPIAAQWASVQTFPADNAAAGIPIPGKIVSATVAGVTVVNGAVNITFGNSANAVIRGKVLTLRPAVVSDAPIVPVTWVCAAGPVPGGMTLQGVDQTNIARDLLPISCVAQ